MKTAQALALSDDEAQLVREAMVVTNNIGACPECHGELVWKREYTFALSNRHYTARWFGYCCRMCERMVLIEALSRRTVE